MSNGTDQQEYNCASQVCCDNADGDRTKRIQSWVTLLTKAMGPGPYTPEQVAEYIDDTWDVAGKGTLYAFKEWVVKTFTNSHGHE
jgi:hypothetical protein